jgi:hypothetical protein
MNKLIKILPFLLLTACQLITEPDLSDKSVYLIAPIDSMSTTTATHTLWWDVIPDAEAYNVIVVSPDWNSIERLVADTNVSGNKFTITLPPGEYDWGVSAFNYYSSTPYSVRHLSIDTSSSLSGQVVVLKSPSEGKSLKDAKVLFEWYKIAIANSYIFDIRRDSWEGPSFIPQQLTSEDTISVALTEGVYAWGVKATNDFSSTLFTTQTLYIDQTPPGRASITNPAFNGDTLQIDNLLIQWNRSGTSVSPMRDSLMVSVDSTFSEGSPIGYYFTTEATEYTLPENEYSSGFYFCRVRTYDEAGNVGPVSATRKFYIE